MNRKERRAAAKTGRLPPGAMPSRAPQPRQGPESALYAVAAGHYESGRYREAQLICEQLLAANPRDAEALHLHAVLALQAGAFEAVIDLAGQAVAANERAPAPHNTLAQALRATGRLDEAVTHYRRAVALAPHFAEAHSNLGGTLCQQGKFDEGIAACRRALSLQPDRAITHSILGAALNEIGQLDEAIAACRRAVALNPNLPEALNNLGTALLDRGELDPAIELWRRALTLDPSRAQPHSNMGIALREKGLPGEAIAAQQAALSRQPDFPRAAAELAYSRALACDWAEAETDRARLLTAMKETRAVVPFLLLALGATAAEQLACAQQWVGAWSGQAAVFHHRPRPASAKIRLGYISEDFRVDPVGTLIPELIERHDRGRFDVTAYCYGPQDSGELRRRFERGFDRFNDIHSASIDEAARQIHADGIDILIDLVGYTAHPRTRILVLRPAPIQISYLGYPGTMGAPFTDYVIADPYIVPPDQQRFYTERLVHLPDCYQPGDTKRLAGVPAPNRAECGLPQDGFVFCCFNNSYKLRPAIFDIWMRLLRQVPGSVLWLVEANRLAAENLRREAAARGVSGDRIVFSPRAAYPDYLARLGLADLFLDTLPYNAGATANDALWAGVPLLTCSGDTYVGRMAGSLLRAAGLPELVTASLAEYEALALRLATEPGLLAGFRERLAGGRDTQPLFDMGRYTRHLESAYVQMSETWRRGEPPKAFAVELEGV